MCGLHAELSPALPVAANPQQQTKLLLLPLHQQQKQKHKISINSSSTYEGPPGAPGAPQMGAANNAIYTTPMQR